MVAWEWNYGDTCILTFPINKTILVEKTALIYSQSNLGPTDNTPGIFGQKAEPRMV